MVSTCGTTEKHSRRMLKKATVITRPTPVRQDAPFRGQGRSKEQVAAVPSGAHGATNKEHHVCARRRVVRRLGPR